MNVVSADRRGEPESAVNSIKKQARIAGFLYFLACLPAPFALIYVPRVLLVPGDATATANRVRASETLLRMSIAAELLSSILLIFAVLALYRLFKGVSEKLALSMAVLIFVSIPISLVNAVNHVAALVVVSGAGFLSPFDARQLDSLTYLFLRLHGQGVIIAQIFWGLWLLPYGMVVMRSGFIPRALGALLMIAGVGYVAGSFAYLFLPEYARGVSQFATVLEFGEVPLLAWLLIWGARERRVGVAAE